MRDHMWRQVYYLLRYPAAVLGWGSGSFAKQKQPERW